MNPLATNKSLLTDVLYTHDSSHFLYAGPTSTYYSSHIPSGCKLQSWAFLNTTNLIASLDRTVNPRFPALRRDTAPDTYKSLHPPASNADLTTT